MKNNSRNYAVVSVLIFVYTFLIVGGIYFLFDLDEDFKSILVTLVAAFLAGAITLSGVILTIKNNESQRERDHLPKKIYNLESAIELLEEKEMDLNERTRVDFLHKRLYLFSYDNNYNLITTDLYKKYTVEMLNDIRKYIIFIDMESYDMFFWSREVIRNLYNKHLLEVEIKLADFTELLVEQNNNKDLLNIEWVDLELSEGQTIQLIEIEKELYKQERKYIYFLGEAIKDLRWNLEFHYEEVIKKMNA